MNSFWCRARFHTTNRNSEHQQHSVQMKRMCFAHSTRMRQQQMHLNDIADTQRRIALHILCAVTVALWQTNDSLRSRLAPEALFKNWNELFNRIYFIRRHRRFLSHSFLVKCSTHLFTQFSLFRFNVWILYFFFVFSLFSFRSFYYYSIFVWNSFCWHTNRC